MLKLLTLTIVSTLALGSQDCPTGQVWNSTVNRCVNSNTTNEQIDNYTECLENQDSDDCNMDGRIKNTKSEYADGESSLLGLDGETANNTSRVINGAMTLVAVGNAFATGGISDMCMSSKIMGATALYGLYAGITLKNDVEDQVKELKEEYQAEYDDEENYKDSQVLAFDYLVKEQEIEKKYAEELGSYHQKMIYGYYAAAAVAVYETFSTGGACSGGEDSGKDAGKDAGQEAGNTGKDATGGGDSSWLSFFTKPPLIIASGLVAGTYAMDVKKQSDHDVDAANANIETINTIREGFIAGIASQCPDGREDLSQPYCYCYLADGKENPNRGKSATCQALFKKQNFYVDTEDFHRLQGKANAQGCVYVDGKFDADCNCKKLKNSKGENACQKLSIPQPVLSSLGTNTGITSSLEDIRDGFSPTDNSFTIATGSGNSNAAATSLRDKIVKMRDAAYKKMGKDPKKLAAKIEKAIAKQVAGGVKNYYMGPGDKLAASRPQTEALKKVVKKAAPKVKKKFGFRGGKGINKKKIVKKKKKNGNFFNFADDGSGATVAEAGSESYMKKKYKYKQNDIVRKKGESIFKIISHRYTVSGLRRLFDGDIK